MPHLNLLEPELEPQKHVLSVFEHLSSLLIKPTHLMAIVVTNCHNHFPSQREDLVVLASGRRPPQVVRASFPCIPVALPSCRIAVFSIQPTFLMMPFSLPYRQGSTRRWSVRWVKSSSLDLEG